MACHPARRRDVRRKPHPRMSGPDRASSRTDGHHGIRRAYRSRDHRAGPRTWRQGAPNHGRAVCRPCDHHDTPHVPCPRLRACRNRARRRGGSRPACRNPGVRRPVRTKRHRAPCPSVPRFSAPCPPPEPCVAHRRDRPSPARPARGCRSFARWRRRARACALQKPRGRPWDRHRGACGRSALPAPRPRARRWP